MIRVIVSGAAGRMGSLVCEVIDGQPDLELAAGYDSGSSEPDRIDALPDADVVVDFTTPDAVMANLEQYLARGWHAVVGTSGFTDDRVSTVKALFGDGPPNCLIVPNFSIGAVLSMRFARQASPHFAAAEVIELHHDEKADAPSGTAIATAKAIASAGPHVRAVESGELVPGALGATVEGVRVHAVRLPGLVAHQEVILGGPGETLTIRHDTTDRTAFLPGVLLAVRGIAGLPGVTVGLEALL